MLRCWLFFIALLFRLNLVCPQLLTYSDEFAMQVRQDEIRYFSVPIAPYTYSVTVRITNSHTSDTVKILLRHDGMPTLDVFDSSYAVASGETVVLKEESPAESMMLFGVWGGKELHSLRYFAGSPSFSLVGIRAFTVGYGSVSSLGIKNDVSNVVFGGQNSADMCHVQKGQSWIAISLDEVVNLDCTVLPFCFTVLSMDIGVTESLEVSYLLRNVNFSASKQNVVNVTGFVYYQNTIQDAQVNDGDIFSFSNSAAVKLHQANASEHLFLLKITVPHPIPGIWCSSLQFKNDVSERMDRRNAAASVEQLPFISHSTSARRLTVTYIRNDVESNATRSLVEGPKEAIPTQRLLVGDDTSQQKSVGTMLNENVQLLQCPLGQTGYFDHAYTIQNAISSTSRTRSFISLNESGVYYFDGLGTGESGQPCKSSFRKFTCGISMHWFTRQQVDEGLVQYAASSSILSTSSSVKWSAPLEMLQRVSLSIYDVSHKRTAFQQREHPNYQRANVDSLPYLMFEGRLPQEVIMSRSAAGIGGFLLVELVVNHSIVTERFVSVNDVDAKYSGNLSMNRSSLLFASFNNNLSHSVVIGPTDYNVMLRVGAVPVENSSTERPKVPSDTLMFETKAAKQVDSQNCEPIVEKSYVNEQSVVITSHSCAAVRYQWLVSKPKLVGLARSAGAAGHRFFVKVLPIEQSSDDVLGVMAKMNASRFDSLCEEEKSSQSSFQPDAWVVKSTSSVDIGVTVALLSCAPSNSDSICRHGGVCVLQDGFVASSSCHCRFPWSGDFCDIATLPTWFFNVQIVMLVLSNAAMAPVIKYCFSSSQSLLWMFGVVLSASAFSSAIYHLCDTDVYCFAGLSFSSLQVFDIFFSTLSIALVLSYYGPWHDYIVITVFMAYVSLLISPITEDATNPRNVILAVSLCVVYLSISWFIVWWKVKSSLTCTRPKDRSNVGGDRQLSDSNVAFVEFSRLLVDMRQLKQLLHERGDSTNCKLVSSNDFGTDMTSCIRYWCMWDYLTGSTAVNENGGDGMEMPGIRSRMDHSSFGLPGNASRSTPSWHLLPSSSADESVDNALYITNFTREDESKINSLEQNRESPSIGSNIDFVSYDQSTMAVVAMRLSCLNDHHLAAGGLIMGIVGLLCFVSQTRTNYWMFHSVWHVMLMMSAYFLLTSRNGVVHWLIIRLAPASHCGST